MELLLVKYGYLLLFLGVVIEGEAFLIAGSFLANRGYFSLGTVALVALAANTISTQFYFMAARTRGRKWFENRFGSSARQQRIIDWTNRHGNWLLLLSRFAVGFRIIIPAACGALGMPVSRFLVLNIIAGLLWVVPTMFLGFYFGASIDAFVREAQTYAQSALLAGALTAGIVLAIHHLRRVRSVFQHLEWSDLHAVIPTVMGFMGAVNIIAAIWPSSESVLRGVRAWLPLEVSQQSRTLMLFTGVALLQVTRNLARRKQLAWYVAVIALSASLLLHFTSGLDAQNSLVAALLLTYLVAYRRRFYTRTDPASLRKGLLVTPLLLLIVFLYGLTGFLATQSQFLWGPGANPVNESVRAGILISTPNVQPASRYAARFLTSVQVAGWLARIYILVLLLRPVILRQRLEAPKADVDRIFQSHGNDPVAPFAIQSNKHHLLLAGGEALVSYASKGSIALACGDPIAPGERFAQAAEEYADHCRKHGWAPCVYLAAEERLPVYHSLKLLSDKLGDEALIDLQSFDPKNTNSEFANVRRYDRGHAPDPMIDEQLEEVTEDWLETRHMREIGFAAGHFSLEEISAGPVFILGLRYRVDAFCAWLTYKNNRGVVLDLVRQRRNATEAAVHSLVLHSLRLLKLEFDEAVIPAFILDRRDIESLNPVWRNRYLVYPRGADTTRITRALKAIEKR